MYFVTFKCLKIQPCINIWRKYVFEFWVVIRNWWSVCTSETWDGNCLLVSTSYFNSKHGTEVHKKKANIMTMQYAITHDRWITIFFPSVFCSTSFLFPSVAPSNAVHSSLFAHTEPSLWIPCLTFPKLILISQAIVIELFSWKPQRKSRGFD